MPEVFNIYCDESCHLENDRQPTMVLGALWCPFEYVRLASHQIREIKSRHGLASAAELKWTKLSPGNLPLYMDLLDYFFDADYLNFRGLVASKRNLRHADFGQTHDEWYYKMYFTMLQAILNPHACFRIFIDVKDSHGAAKVRKLQEVLANSLYDFSRDIVEKVQIVRSHEIDLMQLADVLIGSVSAANRGAVESQAKNNFIATVRRRSGYSLTRSTLLLEKKFNLFHWQGAN